MGKSLKSPSFKISTPLGALRPLRNRQGEKRRMDLRAKIQPYAPWLLQKRTLWVILVLLVISPPIWLGWTQPWQYQPQVPTGPLPEEVAQRPSYPLPPEIQAAKDEGMRLWGLQTPDSMDASEPLLELAAEHGDGDAMYFLGELQRRSSMGGFST